MEDEPTVQGLKKGTISQFKRSAAVSRDGSGPEPMIRGVVVLELCGRMQAARSLRGSTPTGLILARFAVAPVQCRRRAHWGTSGKLRGKKCAEKRWNGGDVWTVNLLKMGMKKEGQGRARLTAWGAGTVRYGSTELWPVAAVK
jgi:hypothetical protein